MKAAMLLRAAAPAAGLSDRALQDRLFRPDEAGAPPRHAVPCWSGRRHPDSWSPHTYDIDDAQAAELCGACPLLAPCLEFALREPQEGIWGGTSPQARAAARRARFATAKRRDRSTARQETTGRVA